MEILFFLVMIVSVLASVNKKANKKVNSGVNSTDMSNNDKRYSTINSHYKQGTLDGVGSNNSGRNINRNTNNNTHTHSYEHKVAPITEATVIEQSEDRREAYESRKKQMKEDLPKSSYSMDGTKNHRNDYREYGKNGDNGNVPLRGETMIICSYCGANNILPANRRKNYNCYFCRQDI